MLQYEGGYTDYMNRKQWNEQRSEAADGGKAAGANTNMEASSGKNWKSGQKKKLKFTYQEQKDYESIESDIAALEEK